MFKLDDKVKLKPVTISLKFWACHSRVDRGCGCCEIIIPTFIRS